MPKIGSMTYPDKIESLLRHKATTEAFAKYTGRGNKKEAQACFLYLTGDFDRYERYRTFHSPKSQLTVPAPPRLEKILRKMTKEDIEKNKAMIDKIIDQVKKNCVSVLNSKYVAGFYESEEFQDFHCKNISGHKNFGTLLVNAKKKLNLKKAESLLTMQEVIREGLFGSKNKAKAMAAKLSKTGKFGSLGNRDIFKEMEKHNFV
jgi:predicted N-acyltransferase